jgi:flagellin
MALTVATNTGALMAQAAASSVNKDMETSMERLSTGKRINGAADDAAGVAIASRLTSEIKGTNQAIRNALDASSLIDTAEGAHIEVSNILQRMRELAVQSANDTNSLSDRQNLQLEVDQLTAEIDRIALSTTWAGKGLLNGTAEGAVLSNSHSDKASFNFQIGSGTGAADTIVANFGSTTSKALNLASEGGNIPTITGAQVTPVTISSTQQVQVDGNKISIVGTFTEDTHSFKINGVSVTFGPQDTEDAFTDDAAGVSADLKATIEGTSGIAEMGITVVDNGDGSVTLNQSTVPLVTSASVTTDNSSLVMVSTDVETTESDSSTKDNQTLVLGGSDGGNRTLTVGGTVESGDLFTFKIDGTAFSVASTDTSVNTTAELIAADINAKAAAATINAGISATSAAGVVTISSTQGKDAVLSADANGVISFSGSVDHGDVLSMKIDNQTVTVTFDADTTNDGWTNDLDGVAAQMADAIRAKSGLEHVSVTNLGNGSVQVSKSNVVSITEEANNTNPTTFFAAEGPVTDATRTLTVTHASTFAEGVTYSAKIQGQEVSITTSSSDGFEDTVTGLADQFEQALDDANIAGIEVSNSAGVLTLTGNPSVTDLSVAPDAATQDATLTVATSTNDQVLTFGGAFNAGDTYNFSINGEALSLEVGAAGYDSGAPGVIKQIEAVIENAKLDGISVSAALQNDGTIDATISMDPIIIEAKALTSSASLVVNEGSVSIDGSVAAGDKLKLTISGTEVEVTAFSSTKSEVASQLAQAIEAANIAGVEVTDGGDGTFALSNSAGSADITTASAAMNAIENIDAALLTVNGQRALMGALSNRMDITVANLTTVSSNLQAGRGRIEDADFASETTSLAKSQILQQASTAMLAQANASKQNVLSLLQG